MVSGRPMDLLSAERRWGAGLHRKGPGRGWRVTVVRGDGNSNIPTVGEDVLYFAAFEAPEFGSMDWEIRRASPESGPSEFLSSD